MIIPFAASINPELSDELLGLEALFRRKAEEGVNFDSLSGPEGRAVVLFRELQLINDLDLTAVLLRGWLLDVIENEGLYSVHPEGFTTLEEAAAHFGVSTSMLSDIRSLYKVVFPMMQSLGLDIPTEWNEIGRSKFRALIPALKCVLTGIVSSRASVNQVVNEVYDDIDATALASGQTLSENERKQLAVQKLLEDGKSTHSELMKRLGAQTYDAVAINKDGHVYLIVAMNPDEWGSLMKRFGRFLDVRTVDTEGYPIESIPEVRQLME